MRRFFVASSPRLALAATVPAARAGSRTGRRTALGGTGSLPLPLAALSR